MKLLLDWKFQHNSRTHSRDPNSHRIVPMPCCRLYLYFYWEKFNNWKNSSFWVSRERSRFLYHVVQADDTIKIYSNNENLLFLSTAKYWKLYKKFQSMLVTDVGESVTNISNRLLHPSPRSIWPYPTEEQKLRIVQLCSCKMLYWHCNAVSIRL